ncbi:MAG: hypothetical protein LAT52_03230 [Balneolales bacterium]|nr:hypothetical protein [Balneolales bacterium]
MVRRITLLALFSICTTALVQAQSGGLQLLSIGPESVSLSLSESVTAVHIGPASIFTNPAQTATDQEAAVSLSHTFWLANSGNSHAAVSIPSARYTWSFGALSSTVSDIEARQTPGAPAGTFDVNYYAFAGGLSRSFGNISAGVTAMYLYEQLFQLSASGYGFNAGLSGTLMDDRIRIGASVLNMGRMEVLAESRTPLPTVGKAGLWADVAQFSVSGSADVPVLISLVSDLHIPFNEQDNSMWLSGGLQATFSNIVALSAAFRTGETKRPFSTGIGITFEKLVFSYAFVPFETGFGLTHSVGMRYFFDL